MFLLFWISDFILNKKFNYPFLNRSAVNGSRHYTVNQHRLPSVSTILSLTKTEEEKANKEVKRKKKVDTEKENKWMDMLYRVLI